MQPQFQPWFIVSDSNHMTARFGAEQSPEGQTQVTVRLQQLVKDVPRQDFECKLDVLREVVNQGEALKDGLEYKETIRLKEPDKVLELKDYTAKFYGRLKPSGEEQVAILIESKATPEQGKEPGRFIGDLDHLKEFAEAGHGYEEVLGQSRRWQPLVAFVEPGTTRDRVIARVVEQSTEREPGQSSKIPTLEEGRLDAHKTAGLFAWPQAMTYVPKGMLIELSKVGDVAIDNAIEFVHFDQERRSSGHVIGQWAVGGRPAIGQKVAWGGKSQAYDNSPLDYLVDYHGQTDGKNVPASAPFVLIKDSPTELYRGEVVGVYPTRDEAVRALDGIKREQAIEQARSRDWSYDLTTPSRPR